MKKILLTILAVLFVLPMTVFAKDKEPVKVYVFEAGGCPYCEAQIEYLKSLESYEKKFVVVQKELYIDHEDWEPGKDYDLGVKVAKAYKNAGFADASYQGTPFVVISNLYAAAAYNTDLEDIINTAYEKGDADVISCFEKGNDNCQNLIVKPETNFDVINMTLIICGIIAIIIVYVVKSTMDRDLIIATIENGKKVKETVKETKKEEVEEVSKEKKTRTPKKKKSE